MVKKHSVEALARRIGTRNIITKDSVLDESKLGSSKPSAACANVTAVLKKANDPDIELGPSVMSLKDPISTLRISLPCRSTLCTHNQCFDAESFLQLQEQAPTWQCPICNKTISYDGLAVDQWVPSSPCTLTCLADLTQICPGDFGQRAEGNRPGHDSAQWRVGQPTGHAKQWVS